MNFLDSFLATHKNKYNRALHGLAGVLLLAAGLLAIMKREGAALSFIVTAPFLIGLGHYIEGDSPAIIHFLKQKI